MRRGRLLAGIVGAVLGGAAFVQVAAASNVSAGLGLEQEAVTVPTWLFLMTGGGVVAVSSMLSMLVTDRELLSEVHEQSRPLWSVRSRDSTVVSATRWADRLAAILGVGGLVVVVLIGFLGPRSGTINFGVLLVFVGGRALLTIVAYLVVNPWPALNPWRRIAGFLPTLDRPYPTRLGSWPATAGLLGLVYLEIVLPVTEASPILATLVLAYTALTLAGAAYFGPDDWFRYADPVSVWFRCYGAFAPIQRDDAGQLTLRWPGARLRERDVLAHRSDVAFVIAVVFELTYSGFVATALGRDVVLGLGGFGVPPLFSFLGLLVLGYSCFVGVYWLASRKSREHAKTYVDARYLAFRFAPPLLAIAAGYHLAHYAGFAIALLPSLVQAWLATLAAVTPLSAPVTYQQLVLPGWFGHLEIAFLLVGHLVAIWLAHATAFDVFAGRLQAIRSQYAFVVVMVVYTMISMWLLVQPIASVPASGIG